MTKLVSIIMPTRNGSFYSLKKAVNSIFDTAGQYRDQIEILLRLDSDDHDRVPVACQLAYGRGCVLVGCRGQGYNDMPVYVRSLISIAKGKWCWLFDDDAWIEGDWATPLAECPRLKDEITCFRAQHYALGSAVYKNAPLDSPVGLIVPTQVVRDLKDNLPVDNAWLGGIQDRKLPLQLLPNVTYWHDGRARF